MVAITSIVGATFAVGGGYLLVGALRALLIGGSFSQHTLKRVGIAAGTFGVGAYLIHRAASQSAAATASAATKEQIVKTIQGAAEESDQPTQTGNLGITINGDWACGDSQDVSAINIKLDPYQYHMLQDMSGTNTNETQGLFYEIVEKGRKPKEVIDEWIAGWAPDNWRQEIKDGTSSYYAESFDAEAGRQDCQICGNEEYMGNEVSPCTKCEKSICHFCSWNQYAGLDVDEPNVCLPCGVGTQKAAESFEAQETFHGSWGYISEYGGDCVLCGGCTTKDEDYHSYYPDIPMVALINFWTTKVICNVCADEDWKDQLVESGDATVETIWKWKRVWPPVVQQEAESFEAENQSCRVCGGMGHNKRTCPNKNREDCWSCGWDHNTDKADMLSCSKGYDHVVCSV